MSRSTNSGVPVSGTVVPNSQTNAEAIGEIKTTLAILRAGGIANPIPALELAVAALSGGPAEASALREALESVINEVSWFARRKKNLADLVNQDNPDTWADVLERDLDIGRDAIKNAAPQAGGNSPAAKVEAPARASSEAGAGSDK